MIDQRAASRYSQALFKLAEQKNQLAQIDEQLLMTRELVEKHPEISHLVLNSTISLAEKEDFIEKIVPQGTVPLLIHFLKVLIEKKRFRELVLIQKKFRRLFEKKQGVQEVEAVTASELQQDQELKLKSMLKNKLRAEIRLVKKTDPNLIGGLILRFDGNEINASYRARLDEIKQSLLSQG